MNFEHAHMKASFLYFIMVFPMVFSANGCRSEKIRSAKKPNIIIILSDDMGYSDIGCYGGEIKTPVLDELAANGLRFTQFYNAGRCCPTRASLLTGLYPHQASLGHLLNDDGLNGFRGDLGNDCVTISEVLKSAGYANYVSGKWHVTSVYDGKQMTGSSRHNWPLQRGFDRFYGTIHGAGSFWDPNSLVRDNEFISPFADQEYKPIDFYYTDAISHHAAKFIQEHNKKQPFFLYVAYTAAHWPLHAPEEEIEKYKGYYDEGYSSVREIRYERMKNLGVISEQAKLSPQEGKWNDVEFVDWEIRCMETYAAMITRMDAGIGEIVQSLVEKGQMENTLILFLQDNGGCQETWGRKNPEKNSRWKTSSGPRPMEPAYKPMLPEELQTRMIPRKTRDGYPVRMGQEAMPGPSDTYVAYGINWANVSNTPFRMYKHFVHEGGISTPLIAHWPAGIKSINELRHAPTHLIDIMATCVDVSGASYPESCGPKVIQPLEGKSLRSVFEKDQMQERPLLFEHENNAAIRKGNWKLVGINVFKNDSVIHKNWELYNIGEDRSELHDLSEIYPEKTSDLIDLFVREAYRVRILPSKFGCTK